MINNLLDYDFIFKKGILFIRLKGDITKETSSLFADEINPLILDNGIKNVVLNLSRLRKVDNVGMSALYDSYLSLTKESDISICEIPLSLRKRFRRLLKYVKEREDEYTILMRN